MPRIVPLQLLKCLKVLLDYNGGILSESEVKRLAGLMTKYSKKLVSKCIYVQILKCTKTELLGEFMGAGGWTLVHMWLNDAIRAMNWPLVQEILELLLLCPVDVDRLKSNSAPKLVRGLCKDGGIEGVRILAKRLVEQWLKVVTADANLGNTNSVSVNPQIQASATTMPPQAAVLQTPASVTAHITSTTSSTKTTTAAANLRQKTTSITQNGSIDSKPSKQYEIEQDPLADVPSDVPPVPSYGPTPAQKKASEAGLVYKIVVKDGQQVLTKVDTTSVKVQQQQEIKTEYAGNAVKLEENEKENVEADEEEDERDTEEDEQAEAIKDDVVDIDQPDAAHKENKEVVESLAKSEKDAESSEEETAHIVKKTEKRNDIVKTIVEQIKPEELKEKTEKKMERKSSKDSKESKSKEKDKEREKEKEKEKKSDKNKERKSSSSSGYKSSSSSSNHKSSTKNSSSSSSVSKSKSTPSSSSSHRSSSSSDKYRSGSDKDKERTSSSTSSSKDKDRGNSSSNSSSSKHKSSSSKPTSSSSTSSSSSSNKERSRDKDKEKNSSASSSSFTALTKKEKDNIQAEKDKETLASMTKQPSLDKLGKIPKKLKESLPDSAEDNSNSSSTKPPPTTSITIPSKKASMSIEIRRDSEKAKTVKTYKSQFRSHGLNEEAPPPPSRKGLKKPTSTSSPGTSIPSSLPSSSLKRASPPHSSSELPIEKKAKLDIAAIVNNAVGTEKPGAIKLIAAKKIQTLVETNIFSDALSAATGPKKATKRKRPTTPRDGPSPPTSPEAPKVAPLKFYQDTLDENKAEDKSPSVDQKSADESPKDDGGTATGGGTDENGNATEDDDDIPLKKVKEDIEQKVLKEQKAAVTSSTIEITSSSDTEENEKASVDDQTKSEDSPPEPKKPGPGCGPNGPPGVLMLHHRRKGPKKKLCWRPQEQLEQIRYFELDETERCNVTKNFMDMKNMERFSERDAINMSRRGFNHEDNMEPQTAWKALFMIDDVPPHPDGNQSKERKVQADREQTTLRALYFSHSMIPDSPTEAELEPHFPHDIPVIPLDDITGNPDAVNDFTSMPWPEPKGSPKHGDSGMGGLEGLGNPADMFGNAVTPFNPFISRYAGSGGAPTGIPTQQQQIPTMQVGPPSGGWQGANGPMPNGMMGPGAIPMMGPGIGNPFAGPMPSSPVMEMGPNGPMGPGPMSGPSPNFMGGRNQFGPGGPPGPNQYGPGGPQFGPGGYNGPPNFGHMGPGGPMGPGPMGPGPMGPGPMMNNMGPNHMGGPPNGGSMMSGPNGPGSRSGNNRNANGNNWRSGGSKYSDNNNGGNNGSWRPAGTGQNRNNDWMRENSHSNNGVCKGFMRGHCRLGKSCKYIHPKSKRI